MDMYHPDICMYVCYTRERTGGVWGGRECVYVPACACVFVYPLWISVHVGAWCFSFFSQDRAARLQFVRLLVLCEIQLLYIHVCHRYE